MLLPNAVIVLHSTSKCGSLIPLNRFPSFIGNQPLILSMIFFTLSYAVVNGFVTASLMVVQAVFVAVLIAVHTLLILLPSRLAAFLILSQFL